MEHRVADIVMQERRPTMRDISDPVYVAVIAAASLVAALAIPSVDERSCVTQGRTL